MKLRYLKRSIYILTACFVLTNTIAPSSVMAAPNETNTQKSEQTNESWPKGPSITAKTAIVMDASTGLVLYEKKSKEKMYPASITKIMTTLLAVENSNLSDTVTFSHDAIFNVDLDSSRIGINVGEQLSMEDCLYGIMLASANEVSYGVAEHVGGTMENFVNMMNQRAQELGAVNTHFANPHGLQNPDHYTCAYDMALIAREAIKNTTFQQITGTRTYVIPETNKTTETRPLANHHKFIKGDIRYEGAVGGKTGYTSTAKYTLVTYAKRGDMNLICVVMASDSVATEYSDTASLLDYGFNNFSIYSISSSDNALLTENNALFKKYSSIFNAENTFLTTGDDGYVVLPNNVSLDSATKEITYCNPKDNSSNNVIGQIKYTYKGRTVGQTDIIYHNSQSEILPTMISSVVNSGNHSSTTPTLRKFTFSLNIFIVILITFTILAICYILFIIRPRRKRRRDYQRRRQHYRRNYQNYYE